MSWATRTPSSSSEWYSISAYASSARTRERRAREVGSRPRGSSAVDHDDAAVACRLHRRQHRTDLVDVPGQHGWSCSTAAGNPAAIRRLAAGRSDLPREVAAVCGRVGQGDCSGASGPPVVGAALTPTGAHRVSRNDVRGGSRRNLWTLVVIHHWPAACTTAGMKAAAPWSVSSRRCDRRDCCDKASRILPGRDDVQQ